MTTIQVRIDKKTKDDAKKVLNELGLDMSSAVKIYFKQIAVKKKLPFELITENGLTIQQEEEILKASEDAKKGINVSKAYDSMDEFIKDLNN